MPKPVRPALFDKKYPIEKFPHYQKPASMICTTIQCCGIKEMHGIQNVHIIQDNDDRVRYEPQTPEELIPQIQALYNACGRPRPFLIFSDSTGKSQTSGKPLADYIEKHKLGTVHRSTMEYNKNSGNNLVVYLWTVDTEAFPKHKVNLGETNV